MVEQVNAEDPDNLVENAEVLFNISLNPTAAEQNYCPRNVVKQLLPGRIDRLCGRHLLF